MRVGRGKSRSEDMRVSVMGKGLGGELCVKTRQKCCAVLEEPWWVMSGNRVVGIKVDDIDAKTEFPSGWMNVKLVIEPQRRFKQQNQRVRGQPHNARLPIG